MSRDAVATAADSAFWDTTATSQTPLQSRTKLCYRTQRQSGISYHSIRRQRWKLRLIGEPCVIHRLDVWPSHFHFFACATLLTGGAASTAAQATTATTQAQPVFTNDDLPRVMIAKSTIPLANAMNDAGRVDGDTALERMASVLGASAEQEQQVLTLLDSQQTKGSPNYHRWLTPEEFGNRFEPAPDDLEQVRSW